MTGNPYRTLYRLEDTLERLPSEDPRRCLYGETAWWGRTVLRAMQAGAINHACLPPGAKALLNQFWDRMDVFVHHKDVTLCLGSVAFTYHAKHLHVTPQPRAYQANCLAECLVGLERTIARGEEGLFSLDMVRMGTFTWSLIRPMEEAFKAARWKQFAVFLGEISRIAAHTEKSCFIEERLQHGSMVGMSNFLCWAEEASAGARGWLLEPYHREECSNNASL